MRARSAAALVLSALVVAACGSAAAPTVRLETAAAPLTSAAAERLAASTDISALSAVASTDAPALRDDMLAQLRTEGAVGTRAAELLTTGFPKRTASVPVVVRECTVDGVDAVVVVEAYGDAGKTLTHRRLWVFDRTTGAILRAASFL
ncbi:MAG TPA: hypothetical protein VIL15_04480 [Coriobacteriia bacterium]